MSRIKLLDKQMWQNKQTITAIAVIGVVVAVLAALLIFTRPDPLETTEGRYETSIVGVVQTSLDVYYLDRNYYPVDYESLIAYEENEEYAESLRKYRQDLRDFKYTSRGDGKAYLLTYTNVAGDKTVIEGEYEKDFH